MLQKNIIQSDVIRDVIKINHLFRFQMSILNNK